MKNEKCGYCNQKTIDCKCDLRCTCIVCGESTTNESELATDWNSSYGTKFIEGPLHNKCRHKMAKQLRTERRKKYAQKILLQETS